MTHKPIPKWILRLKAWKESKRLPEGVVKTRFAFMWGCGTVEKPNLKNTAYFNGPDPDHDRSLYWNGIFYMRVTTPFGIFLHFRWSGKPGKKRQYLQIGLGRKLNGQIATTWRISGDEASADGVYGANHGQAQGYACGPH